LWTSASAVGPERFILLLKKLIKVLLLGGIIFKLLIVIDPTPTLNKSKLVFSFKKLTNSLLRSHLKLFLDALIYELVFLFRLQQFLVFLIFRFYFCSCGNVIKPVDSFDFEK
jgi:hypothetical protein